MMPAFLLAAALGILTVFASPSSAMRVFAFKMTIDCFAAALVGSQPNLVGGELRMLVIAIIFMGTSLAAFAAYELYRQKESTQSHREKAR